MNARTATGLRKSQEKKEKEPVRTSWPTLPCCDAMRAGLACDCCEVIDS